MGLQEAIMFYLLSRRTILEECERHNMIITSSRYLHYLVKKEFRYRLKNRNNNY
jgi:hypothetical protein